MRALPLFLVAAALAGCTEPELAGFGRPAFVSEAAQAHHDLRFLPRSAALAPGERERLAGFLRALVLRPGDDVVLHIAGSGSTVLDRSRVTAAGAAVAASAGAARVRIADGRGFDPLDPRPDTALVQAFRFDRVRVDCGTGAPAPADPAFAGPPPRPACANEANLAHMTVLVRDLTHPRLLAPAGAARAAEPLLRTGPAQTGSGG